MMDAEDMQRRADDCRAIAKTVADTLVVEQWLITAEQWDQLARLAQEIDDWLALKAVTEPVAKRVQHLN
jgi:hypothetical protein